jgi:integrase
MFFRSGTKSWYVKIDGKFVPLGRDERAARQKYQQLVPPEAREDTDDVQTLVAAYLGYVASNLSPGTYGIASTHLNSFLAHLGDSFPNDEVRGFHLQQWADKRFAGLSDTYKNQGMRTVKACWSWGTRNGFIPADPIRPVRLPPAAQRETFFAPEQWPAMVAAVPKQAFRDYLTVALESGLRPQEIHQARVRHYQAGMLVFAREESKGKKRRRVIPLNPVSVQIVERLIAQRSGPNDYIFLNSQGRPWCKSAVNCAMRRLRKKADFPGVCAYSLRHSFAYAALTQGANPMQVAKAMGHVSTRMIDTRYGHVEQSLDYLARGKALKDNPFLPATKPAKRKPAKEKQVTACPPLQLATSRAATVPVV